MSEAVPRHRSPHPLDRLPTLTEVVHAGDAARAQRAQAPAASPREVLSEAALAALTRRLEVTLEARLRDALAPALARAADILIREARDELASALREEVARAVHQEMLRSGS